MSINEFLRDIVAAIIAFAAAWGAMSTRIKQAESSIKELKAGESGFATQREIAALLAEMRDARLTDGARLGRIEGKVDKLDDRLNEIAGEMLSKSDHDRICRLGSM